MSTETPAFNFGPDAPFRVHEWITESGYAGYRVEGPRGFEGHVNPREFAEQEAWRQNLLHFGPALLAELEALRTERDALRDDNYSLRQENGEWATEVEALRAENARAREELAKYVDWSATAEEAH